MLVALGRVGLVEAPLEEVRILVRRILRAGQRPVVSPVLMEAPGTFPVNLLFFYIYVDIVITSVCWSRRNPCTGTSVTPASRS